MYLPAPLVSRVTFCPLTESVGVSLTPYPLFAGLAHTRATSNFVPRTEALGLV